MPKARIITPFILFCSLCKVAVASIELEVNITGVDGLIRDNVISYLSIYQQKDHPNLTAGRIHRLHDKAIGEIKSALQPFGYYHPDIQSELVHDEDKWTADYSIDTGRPILVSKLDIQISGDGAQEGRQRPASPPVLQQGE